MIAVACSKETVIVYNGTCLTYLLLSLQCGTSDLGGGILLLSLVLILRMILSQLNLAYVYTHITCMRDQLLESCFSTYLSHFCFMIISNLLLFTVVSFHSDMSVKLFSID